MTDTAFEVGIVPAERLGVFGIGIDVAGQLARQIGHRGKDTADDDVSLQLREPELHLIQPRRVGRCEMKLRPLTVSLHPQSGHTRFLSGGLGLNILRGGLS